VLRSPQTPQALLKKAHVPSVFSTKKEQLSFLFLKTKYAIQESVFQLFFE